MFKSKRKGKVRYLSLSPPPLPLLFPPFPPPPFSLPLPFSPSLSFLPWPVWLSWLQCHPINQKVTGWIPHQGTHLGCRFGPELGRVQGATDPCFSLTSVFLSLCLSFPPPLSKINERVSKINPQVRIKKTSKVFLAVCHLEIYA